MSEFCTLSIPQLFGRVSINTLKARVSETIESEIISNGWSYLLELRSSAYSRFASPQIDDVRDKPAKTKLQITEDSLRQAQIHAHILELGLSDTLLKLNQFVSNSKSLSLDEMSKLQRILDDAWLKFEDVISPVAKPSHSSKLSVINGGKP